MTPQHEQAADPRSADAIYRQTVSHFDGQAATGEWSRLYEVADGLTYHFHVRRHRVTSLLPENVGRVVDLGCGPGIMVPTVLDRGGRFVGVDMSPEMVTEASAKYAGLPGVEFMVGNIEQLDLPDEAFDQVICMGVIEYLEAPDKALREIGRILRPGGVAVVSVSRRYHTDRLAAPLTAPIRWVARRLGFAGSGQVHRSGMQPKELDSAAALGGMAMECFSNYAFTPLPYPLTRIAPNLTMRFNMPFERLHRTRNPVLASLARGYLARYRKVGPPAGGASLPTGP